MVLNLREMLCDTKLWLCQTVVTMSKSTLNSHPLSRGLSFTQRFDPGEIPSGHGSCLPTTTGKGNPSDVTQAEMLVNVFY